jgi:hypothetical protein
MTDKYHSRDTSTYQSQPHYLTVAKLPSHPRHKVRG